MFFNPRIATIGVLVLILTLVAVPFTAQAQDLTETFTTADGSLTLNYPSGWTAEEFLGTVLLANSEAATAVFTEGSAVQPGQVVVAVLTPESVAQNLAGSAEEVTSPEGLLTVFLSDTVTTYSEIETETLGGKPVARASATENEELLLAYAIEFESGVFGLVAQITVAGEEGEFEPTLRAVIESMQASAPAEPAESGAVVWQQLFKIEEDSEPGEGYNTVEKIIVGADDTIYVLDSFIGIHVFDADGNKQGVLMPEGMFGSMSALTMDADGNLWTIDFMGTMTQFDTTGAVLTSFDTSETLEMAFFGIELAAGPDGNLYLLNPRDDEEQAVAEIFVFTPAGELLRQFEIGTDEYFYEASLTFGPDGNLYVAEAFGLDGIKVFDLQGNLVREGIGVSQLYNMAGIAVGPDGSIYTAISDSPIFHFAADGMVLGRFGQSQFVAQEIDFEAEELPAMEAGVFYDIGGMALLSNGDLIVGDANPTWWQLTRISFGE